LNYRKFTPKAIPQNKYIYASLIFLAFLLIYTSTATRTVQGGDTGEFMVVANEGGVAHPPGYPLYILSGKLLTQLKISSPAFRGTLPSLISGAITVALLFLILLELESNLLVAFISSIVLGFSKLFWTYSGAAEVFTLNTAIIGAVVFLVAKTYRRQKESQPRSWTIPLLFLLGGLGLSNHHTIVLIFPIFILGFYFASRGENWKRLVLLYGLGLFTFLLGLLPYLYLYALGSKSTAWAWGNTGDFKELVAHFLRKYYGTFKLTTFEESFSPFTYPSKYFLNLPKEFFFLPFIGGVLGLALSARMFFQKKTEEPLRLFYAVLGTSFLLSSLFFMSRFNLPNWAETLIAQRFYILPNFLFTLFLALGLNFLLNKGKRVAQYSKLVIIISVITFLPLNYTQANYRTDTIIEDYVLNALKGVEKEAWIFGEGDTHFYSFLYAKQTLKFREDVQYVDINLLPNKWYMRRLKRLNPEIKFPQEELSYHDFVIKFMEVNMLERPVYIANFFYPEVLNKWKWYPSGLVYRLIPREEILPSLTWIEENNCQIFSGYSQRSIMVGEKDNWASKVYPYYALSWWHIGQAYQMDGRLEKAEKNYQRAREFLPWVTSLDDYIIQKFSSS